MNDIARLAGSRTQSIIDHSKNVANMCAAWTGDDNNWLMGYYHDLGKCDDWFHERLTKGTQFVHRDDGSLALLNLNLFIQSFAVWCHHTGLKNMTEFKADVLKQQSLNTNWRSKFEYLNSQYTATLPVNKRQPATKQTAEQAFHIRYLYSCLVDADSLDAQAFEYGSSATTTKLDAETMLERLRVYVERKRQTDSGLQASRDELQAKAQAAAEDMLGIYKMLAPTGSGKTLASLAFAYKHASMHKRQRIIYVLPYMSIIEQLQATFTDIFGELPPEYLLLHYSNYRSRGNNDRTHILAKNWDSPVVVTTNVQFFESLYSSDRSTLRKLHNISNSVLVFDEVQCFGLKYLPSLLTAVKLLVEHYGCTALFCSATNPPYEQLRLTQEAKLTYRATIELEDLTPFIRTRYCRLDPKFTIKEFADYMTVSCKDNPISTLCIMNTKEQVRLLYKNVEHPRKYHLSTHMYPAHIRAVIDSIRSDLRRGYPILCVATSLIEAGIDIDFETVYRARATLDSVIQAGGRCNREGRRPLGHVYIVHIVKDVDVSADTHNYGACLMDAIDCQNMHDREVYIDYFKNLYHQVGKATDDVLIDNNKLQFENCRLHLIDDLSRPVLVKTADLELQLITKADLCRLQPYTVNIPEHEYERARSFMEPLLYDDDEPYYWQWTGDYTDTGIALNVKDLIL